MTITESCLKLKVVLLAQWMKFQHPFPVFQVDGGEPYAEVIINFIMTFANIVKFKFFPVRIVNRSKKAASIFLFLYRGLSKIT